MGHYYTINFINFLILLVNFIDIDYQNKLNFTAG